MGSADGGEAVHGKERRKVLGRKEGHAMHGEERRAVHREEGGTGEGEGRGTRF